MPCSQKYLSNFVCKDGGKIIQKINSFLAAGREKIHIVADFDMTLTKSNNKMGEHVATWQILGSHLFGETKEEYHRLYNKYRPLEAANRMKESDAIAWWEGTLGLYKKIKLKWSDIARDVEEKMPIRDGTKELFNLCSAKNIPITIISAGIKDVIELWCQKFEVKPAIILSTNFHFDSQGRIKGWDRNSLIHVLNKREQGHKEVSAVRKSRPHTILIGDSVDDSSMVNGTKDVLRIMVDDPRADGLVTKEIDEEGYNKFDLVIKNKSLFPVIEILKLF